MIRPVKKLIERLRKPDMHERGKVSSYATGRLVKQPAVYDDLVGRKGCQIYKEMKNDPDVKAGILIKTGGALSKGWEITPARNSGQQGQEIADFVQAALDDMRGSMDELLEEIVSDALCFGTAIAEKVWRLERGGKYDAKYMLHAIKPKDPAAFSFETDDFNNLIGLSIQHFGKDKKLSPDKFAIFTYQSEHGNPWGNSDLRSAYQWWWFKTKLMHWWAIWLEKYGSPAAMGIVPKGTKQGEKETLLGILERIQQETAIVVEEGTQLDLLSPNSGSQNGYRDALNYCGKQITKAILGQTLATNEGERVGSMALGKVHQDVLSVYIKRLKRRVEEFVDEQIIRDIVDFNFTNRDYPNFALMIDDKDVAALSDVFVKLTGAQIVRPDEGWVREYLGLPGVEKIPEENINALDVQREI